MPGSKAKIVAAAEFGRLMRSRLFLLSVLLVPLVSLGLGLLQQRLARQPDFKLRRLAVLDLSGQYLSRLEQAAGRESGLRIEIQGLKPGGRSIDSLRQSALARVKGREFFALLEIGGPGPRSPAFAYYSNTPQDSALLAWLGPLLDGGNAPRQIAIANFGLGQGPPRLAQAADLWAPLGSMLLMFLIVMLTAPQMMSSVIEEKGSRISEVLLSSVTPFDLMLGKLLACGAAAALAGALYLALAFVAAGRLGLPSLLSLPQALAFMGFLTLAVFMNGSIYMAVGAICSQPKDAQGMLGPIMLLSMMPLLAITPLSQDPQGSLAQALSYFPLSAPFVMFFRLMSQTAPPWGQCLASLAITLAATLFCVWAAGRIFRIGLLAQGKAPGLAQLWRWVFMK